MELLNPFNPKEALDDKLSILDVKARDQNGRQFNVEMQMLAHPFFSQRIVYYHSKLHQQQMHAGDDYSKIEPTISIVFLNNVQFPQVTDCHLSFQILEKKHLLPYSGDLEIHLLELPKFKKTLAELASGLDIWLYFLRHAETLDSEALPEVLSIPLILQAVRELLMLTQTELERERYEARLKAQLDRNTDLLMIQEAQANLRKAEAMTREAQAKGEAIGLAKGKIELIHLCERMLQRPETPLEQLQSLSLDELDKLASSLQARVFNRTTPQ